MGYFFEIGCGFSIFLNTISGGSHKNTISGKLRKIKVEHNGIIPWRYPISKIMAFILNNIFPDHLKQR